MGFFLLPGRALVVMYGGGATFWKGGRGSGESRYRVTVLAGDVSFFLLPSGI